MSFTFSFFYGPSPLFLRHKLNHLQFKKWVGCFVAIFFNKKGFSLHPLRQKIEKAPTFSGTIFAALLIPASQTFWHGFRKVSPQISSTHPTFLPFYTDGGNDKFLSRVIVCYV